MAIAVKVESMAFILGCDSSTKNMSLISDDSGSDTGTDIRRPADNDVFKQRTFQFVPGELAIKCRKLIESYHAMYGYVGLPDMLWLSDARDIIECHPDLAQTFKRASKSRGAKRANESFLLIATIIVSAGAHDFRQHSEKRKSYSAIFRCVSAIG